jgi:hypothetical protein
MISFLISLFDGQKTFDLIWYQRIFGLTLLLFYTFNYIYLFIGFECALSLITIQH